MALTYATTDDLPPWLGQTPVPANADILIGLASRLVRRATTTARYSTDNSGMPTDLRMREAFKDATCAQVAAWATINIDPLAGEVQLEAAPVASKKIGTASITYDTAASASVTAMTARARAAASLSLAALYILADAGLIDVHPGTTR